jgi:protein-tyrosine phosphatase
MNEHKPYTVMTVCTGNICRSPMAEIILRTRFEERGLGDAVRVESSGVSDEEYGNPIDRRAVRVLRDRGYEIPSHHFAHRITPEEIEETDLFLPMTASHMQSLLRQLPQAKRGEVHLYRSFDPKLPKPAPGHESEIDLVDPWYGGPEDFEVAIDQIDGVAPYIVDWVEPRLR